MEWILEKEGRK